ncbi:MAG TPA: hypothetical protein VL995_19470 [Cellvibrio sp.]|nr:hypothetical protein [Cellvibrio sp.]
MTDYFLIAAALAFTVGVIHSILGELLIFRHLRKDKIVPTLSAPPLRERHVRILWASWHIVTIFGFGFGVVLIRLSQSTGYGNLELFIGKVIIYSMLASSLLVLWATNGKHPGWVGLAAIALFTWLDGAIE